MDTLCNLYLHREEVAWAPQQKQLPVTLITGFLGAGKTSLVTHILHNKHNLKVAAAVNDFAEVNIDGQIVRGTQVHDDVVELSNGCLCCSISGEFKKAVWSLLQDCDIGKIDYLVVETSGVSDPQQTISTLEEEYGKMYRVRLDAVVTVVDTDDLVAKLGEDTDGASQLKGLGSVAAVSQLKCADVVLLNKKDLVSKKQLTRAKDFIECLVPGVRVYSCTQCAVPLHWIMEVDEVAAGSQVVSHEVTTSAYTVSLKGGEKNKERHLRGAEDGGRHHEHSGGRGHLSADEFSSLVFESSKPLSLARFQAFLGKEFPPGLQRMKGTAWFEENCSVLYTFHMSGRRRYDMAPLANQANSLTGSFMVQLVGIGKINVDVVRSQLEKCVYTGEESSSYILQQRKATLEKMVSGDDRFQAIEGLGAACYVDFRLTGCVEYGVTEEEAAGFHGINFNQMNTELARRVNGSSDKVSLLPVVLPSGVVVCRHGVLEESDFSEAWRVAQDAAGKIVDKFYRAVGVCKCGR